MKVTIVEFPGASGAEDTAYAFSRFLGAETEIIWHDQESLGAPDLLVIPGGFSYCDYLRPGALARSSAVAPSIRRHCREKYALGIGNGFQILCELGVLPGALLVNKSTSFLNQTSYIKAQESICLLTKTADPGRIFKLPLACYSGSYYADKRMLVEIQEKQLNPFIFCDEYGDVSDEYCPTGSVHSIAGMTNYKGNVLGVIVHPERYVEEILGGTDGIDFLKLILSAAGHQPETPQVEDEP